MNLILYSTGCPRCSVLKKKLNEKGIPYNECSDIDKMENMGIETVPVLSVDGEFKDFVSANNWINEFEGE